VAGLGRKDEEFWDYVKESDFVGLVETWMERKGWEQIKGWLPRSHEWEYREARKEKRKGRAKGGMLIGRKKGWGEGDRDGTGEEKEGVTMTEIREGREKWVIVTVYNRGEWKDLEKRLEEVLGEIEDIEESILIIGGDFNIRTGELGGGNEEEEDRRSRDRIINNNGKNLIGWIQDKGWYILNGRTKGD